MAEGAAYGAVPPPVVQAVDASTAFADALKRAKEVRITEGKWYVALRQSESNSDFTFRSRLGWVLAAVVLLWLTDLLEVTKVNRVANICEIICRS